MKNESKVEVKLKLDKHRFIRLEVEKEKLPLVRANNREISRNEKREVRHESMYSLETLSEKVESHERAHPPHSLGQGIAEQPCQQGRKILRRGGNLFIVRRGAAACTGVEGRNL